MPEPDPANRSTAGGLNRRDALVLAGFFLFVLIFFFGALAQGERCLGRPDGDGRNLFYGWRAFGFGEVRAGRFPLWNPYEFLGMPFVASLQPAMFYPTNWLCAAMPLCRAINWGIALNLFLSGLFAYLWARRYGLRWVGAAVAAAAYAFGAPQIMHIYEGHWSFLEMMPWIPCVLLCAEMFVCGGFQPLAIVLGAAAVAMEWFGGNPQYAFYGGIAAALYLAGRLWQRRELGARGPFDSAQGRPEQRRTGVAARAVGSFALIYVIGSALAGAQLIPALELFLQSSRRGQLSYAWVSQFSFPPEGLMSFLVPDIFGSDVAARYWGRWNIWEMSPYVGVVAAGLAFIALLRGRRAKALLPGCIALICLLFAMAGDAIFYRLLPGFDLFRAQARWLCPASLFIGLLAGIGADSFAAPQADVEKQDSRAHGRALWVLACLAALLILAGAALCRQTGFAQAAWTRFMDAMLKVAPGDRVYFHGWTPPPEFKLTAMREAGLSILRSGLFLAALANLLWLALRRRLKPGWAAAALLALVAIDAWTFGHRYMTTFDPQEDGLSQKSVAFLAERFKAEPFRFARGDCFSLPTCEGMTHHFTCLEGIQPNVPSRFRDVFWSLQGEYTYTRALDRNLTSYFMYNFEPPLMMLNLRYFVEYPDSQKMPIEGLLTVYEDPQIRIDELPHPCPRAWLVHRYAVIGDKEELLRALPSLNYERAALFEEDPGCAVEEPPVRRSQGGPEQKSNGPPAAEVAPQIARYEPAHVDVKVRAAAPALLVLSDLFYPGWEATVDGRPAKILRADYVMRAVAIPAGAHDVEFLYRPESFRAGIRLSAAGGLAVALLILWHLSARRRRGNA